MYSTNIQAWCVHLSTYQYYCLCSSLLIYVSWHYHILIWLYVLEMLDPRNTRLDSWVAWVYHHADYCWESSIRSIHKTFMWNSNSHYYIYWAPISYLSVLISLIQPEPSSLNSNRYLCPKFQGKIYDCGIEFIIVMASVTCTCFRCEGVKL